MQESAFHPGACRVGVRARERDRAGAALEEGAAAGHVAGIGAVARLVEEDAGIVDDVALQARSVAQQDAGIDGGAAGVGIRAR